MGDNIVYLLSDKDIDKSQVLKTLGVNNNNNEYKIDTKYYTANINIKTIDLDKDNSDIKHSNHQDGNGIVLLFDSSNLNSFELIKSYIKNNKKIDSVNYDDDNDNEEENDDEDNQLDDKLYLLVDINKSSGNPIEDDIEEWCMDNLIEWVIFDTLSHKEYDIRKSDLTEIDEKVKYGVDRVVEILESNMWPKMDLKNNSASKKKEEAKVEEDEEFSSLKDNQFLQESLKKVEGFFKKSPPQTTTTNTKKDNSNNVNVNSLTIEQESNEEDDEDDDPVMMENTFKELQQLREHMKSLPDDQRRDMAAKVALMFAKSLNFDD